MNINRCWAALRALLAIVAFIALALIALSEIGAEYPVPWFWYPSVAALFAFAFLQRAALRNQVSRIITVLAVWIALMLVYFVPWSSRKPFLGDLYSIRPGMSEQHVRSIMGRYMEGTGLPAPPPPPQGTPTTTNGTLTIENSGSQYATSRSPSGEMTVRDSLIFRHRNDADWGIVAFTNGRVTRVEFSPD